MFVDCAHRRFTGRGVFPGPNKRSFFRLSRGQNAAVVLISPNVRKIPSVPARFGGFSANLLFVAKSVMQADKTAEIIVYVNVTYAKWDRTGTP